MTPFAETRTRLVVLAPIVAGLVAACSGPDLSLHKDPDQIREALLARTPVGTSSDSVIQSLQAHHYSMNQVKTGYLQRTGNSSFEEVGVASIKADLGRYYISPFSTTDVTGYWAFDIHGNLVNIRVSKGDDIP
jgi:hypothetical protein